MSEAARLMKKSLPIWAVLLILALAPLAGGWGMSVHHDQAILIGTILKETPTIPEEIRENVDGDAIYNLSTAPDDWRSATGEWGTWHYNMAENARQEFKNIRNAWADNDFDNSIARIGVVLHFVGDVMYMPHNEGIRQYYENNIPPLGSEEPLWGQGVGGESGKYFTANDYFHATHYANQQAEAYTDSDSAWYPLKPENYGPTDNGSLDWFLDNYLIGPLPLTSDINTSAYRTNPSFVGRVIPMHIAQCNPYDDWSTDDRVDNRWFYWVNTRDPAIPKQDADNTMRLTYNGVYRALRDGAYRSQTGTNNNPPSNWSYWPWPTQSAWLSLNDDLYKEGMDTARWYSGVTNYGSTPEESGQGVSPQPSASPLLAWIAIPIILVLVTFTYIRLKRSRGAGETRP